MLAWLLTACLTSFSDDLSGFWLPWWIRLSLFVFLSMLIWAKVSVYYLRVLLAASFFIRRTVVSLVG